MFFFLGGGDFLQTFQSILLCIVKLNASVKKMNLWMFYYYYYYTNDNYILQEVLAGMYYAPYLTETKVFTLYIGGTVYMLVVQSQQK